VIWLDVAIVIAQLARRPDQVDGKQNRYDADKREQERTSGCNALGISMPLLKPGRETALEHVPEQASQQKHAWNPEQHDDHGIVLHWTNLCPAAFVGKVQSGCRYLGCLLKTI
jgi:hypothetical protein